MTPTPCFLAIVCGLHLAGALEGPVEDTYLAEGYPNLNFGREPVLEAGPGKAVLVRFPSLEWVYSGSERVTGAVLRLNVVGGAPLSLKSVGRVLRRWDEGPGSRSFLLGGFRSGKPRGATWAERDSQGSKWSSPGAASGFDAEPVEHARAVLDGGALLVTGLADAVSKMLRDPTSNHGFLLEFSEDVVFASSETAGMSPQLMVEAERAGAVSGPNLRAVGLEPLGLDPSKPPGLNDKVRWRATFVNTGDQAATNYVVDWEIAGRFSTQTPGDRVVGPGETVAFEVEVPWIVDPTDPRAHWLRVGALAAGSKDPVRPAMAVPVGGLAVRFLGSPPAAEGPQAVVAQVNGAWLARSRFSFAPDGCRERVRLVVEGPADIEVPWTGPVAEMVHRLVAAIDPLRAWRDPGSGPLDTRDDSAWPAAKALPPWPDGEPEEGAPPLPVSPYLDSGAVAALNALAGLRGEARRAAQVAVSPGAIVRFQDAGGRPLADALLTVRQGDGSLAWPAPFKLTATGAAALTSRGPLGPIGEAGPRPWLDLEVNMNGSRATVRLDAPRLVAEAARGNTAPFIDLIAKVTSGVVDRSKDLALDCVASDSRGRFPAELRPLTDGDPATEVALMSEPSDWVEIDLGRDRLVAEVAFHGRPWPSYDVYLRRTGQQEAQLWCRERQGSRVATALAQRARYVRIVCRTAATAELAGVSVHPLQVAER